MALVDMFSDLSRQEVALLALGAFALYAAAVGIRRLYFSPISHIPGPRLAAMTWTYEFWYDIVLGGQYTFKILELHERFGPIVRINPVEVHIGDPEFYSEVYASAGRRRQKTNFFVKQFGAPESALATIDHDHHKLRRAALNPFFSTQSVRKLQSVIEERADALLERLRSYGKTNREPTDVMFPFSAFTNDVICEYAFARSDHLIEDATFGKVVTDNLLTGTHYGKWIQHIYVILQFINALPESLSGRFVPGWAGFLQMKHDILAQIAEIQASEAAQQPLLDLSHPTIFHSMLASDSHLPPHEKTVTRLAQDGQILVQGGTLTTSWTLSVAAYHLLSNPRCLRRLRDELREAMPDPNAVVPLATLESLPYLRAVVKESLRLALGTSGRLTRVAPDETLTYTDPRTGKPHALPPGTHMSMTPYQTIMSPTLFPDPEDFHPERWLDGGEQRLERYFVIFGGGTRVCLGMALAQAETFLMLAKLYRLWGGIGTDGEGDYGRDGDVGVLRLFETTKKDCAMAYDYFIPIPYQGSKGVRVIFETY